MHAAESAIRRGIAAPLTLALERVHPLPHVAMSRQRRKPTGSTKEEANHALASAGRDAFNAVLAPHSRADAQHLVESLAKLLGPHATAPDAHTGAKPTRKGRKKAKRREKRAARSVSHADETSGHSGAAPSLPLLLPQTRESQQAAGP